MANLTSDGAQNELRSALRTTINMTVAIHAICAAARADDYEGPGFFDAISACIDKIEDVICPIADDLGRSKEFARG